MGVLLYSKLLYLVENNAPSFSLLGSACNWAVDIVKRAIDVSEVIEII